MSKESKPSITIVNPYRTKSKEITSECGLSRVDNVERGGYVSPDKKIETYIQTGMLLQNMHPSGDSYELQGTETDLEADSEEYRDELTADAESFDEQPLPQFVDKLSASEILSEADRALENASKAKGDDKSSKNADDASKRVSEAIESVLKAYDKLSKDASKAGN